MAIFKSRLKFFDYKKEYSVDYVKEVIQKNIKGCALCGNKNVEVSTVYDELSYGYRVLRFNIHCCFPIELGVCNEPTRNRIKEFKSLSDIEIEDYLTYESAELEIVRYNKVGVYAKKN